MASSPGAELWIIDGRLVVFDFLAGDGGAGGHLGGRFPTGGGPA